MAKKKKILEDLVSSFIKETKEVETKEVETKEVETKEVETKEVETKEVETKEVETKKTKLTEDEVFALKKAKLAIFHKSIGA